MKLNKTDLKILELLDENPKASVSYLAKKVRLSQPAVTYKIQNLLKNKIIIEFSTVINPMNIGYQMYRVLFQLKGNYKDKIEAMIDYLKKLGVVFWSAIVGGSWDLAIDIYSSGYHENLKYISEFVEHFPDEIANYEMLEVIQVYQSNYKFLQQKKSRTISMRRTSETKIDQIDHKILNSIKNNCRKSSLEIANVLNVNYKTIQNRIKKLEEKKIIVGYKMFIHPETMGKETFKVLLSLGAYKDEDIQQIIQFGKNHKSISDILQLLGRFQIDLEIEADNRKHLQDILIEIREKFPIVKSYEIVPLFEYSSLDHFPEKLISR